MEAQASLAEVTAQRDGYRRLSEELFRLLDEHGLVPEARHRLDALDRGVPVERAESAVHPS